MAQINEWLSIDKANGSGDATITLTASSSTELTERMASLEIRGITKSVYINITQDAFVAPPSTNNEYFWIKLEEDGDIQGLRTTFEYSYNLTNWNSCPTTLSVPADTYVWFRNTSSNLNTMNISTILFTQRGSVGGDLSSMGNMTSGNFRKLFNGNIYIVDASELILPWNTLANFCFEDMFYGCKNLTTTPELPATTLAEYCYNGMFNGCNSLTTAPVLPATTLLKCCYGSMFKNCTSLTTAPVISATTSVNDCCSNMFDNCTSLTEFEIGEWVTEILSWFMFNGCTNLKTIIAKPSTAPTIKNNTFEGIAENGTLYVPTGSDYSSWLSTNSYYLGYYGWNVIETEFDDEDDDTEPEPEEPDTPINPEQPNNDYFWIKLEKNGDIQGLKVGTFQHSYDRINWYYSPATLSVPANTYVWFRNTYPPILNSENETKIHFTERGSIGGDLSSIGDMSERNFIRLFMNNIYLVDASELILPWDVLAEGCYELMFADCTSLTTAPILPATTLVNFCYFQMFFKCKNLSMVECHAEDISAGNCLDDFLYNVSPTGTFIKKQGVYYPRGDNGIPSGWTIQNIA